MRIVKIVTILLILIGGIVVFQFSFRSSTQTSPSSPISPYSLNRSKVEILSMIPEYGNGCSIRQIALLESGEAWAVTFEGKASEYVYHRKSIGKTWDKQPTPGNGSTLQAIHFFDSQYGWAVGGSGLLIRTMNGGESWNQVDLPTKAELQAVCFVSRKVGFIAGSLAYLIPSTGVVVGGIELLCTEDGGENWHVSYKDNDAKHISRITSFSDSGMIALLDGSRLIRTDNQGKTWQEVSLNAQYINSLATTSTGIGWMVGHKATFHCSTDTGKTWQQPVDLPQSIIRKNWNDLCFNSKGTGLVVGETGSIALTRDNGKTWELQDLGIADRLYGVYLQNTFAIITGRKNVYQIDISS